MSSEELRNALSRRLKKVEDSTFSSPEPSNPDTSGEGGEAAGSSTLKSPERKQQPVVYRSGWSSTPPIPRANIYASAPLIPAAPVKHDAKSKKPTSAEINKGLVDRRTTELADATPPPEPQGLTIPVKPVVIPQIKVIIEGYLSKFSSGAIMSRWQKRYFVLRETELEYYSKHSAATLAGSASVKFPISRIKAVSASKQSDKEFELTIGRGNRRKYQLKASEPEQAKDWVTSIQTVLTRYASMRDSMGESAESVASSQDVTGASSLNDDSSVRSGSDSRGVPQPTEFTNYSTVWEQEISGEEIDALFAEWFSFLDDARAEIKAGRMIDAASRTVSDLWAVLGSLPRGEDVIFLEAHPTILKRINQSLNMQAEKDRCNIITGEYVMRLCSKFLIWLGRRPMNPEDIPVILEWISRFMNQVRSIPVGVHDLANLTPPEDLSPSPTHSDRGTIISTPEKWAKGIRMLIRKLGCEWEVHLIEHIQKAMPSESIWDYPPVVGDTAPTAPHGPTRKWIVPEALLGAPVDKPVLATSWLPQYITLLNDKCLSRSSKGTPWSVAYPTCVDVLISHAGNAVVACINACWREFKKRSALYASHRSSSRVGTVINKMKNLTGRLSISTGSPTRPHPESQGGSSSTPPLNAPPTALGELNMLAFGNEATLMSVFCQHASAIPDFVGASPVFTTCMESLSQTFANTSNEVSKSIVKIHYLKKNYKLIMSAFDPKCLAVRVKVPITETLDAARQFLSYLQDSGSHDLLQYLMDGQVMQGVANAYVTSLIRHKPKMAKFTRLAAVVSEDEGLFFNMFKNLGRQPAEINTAIDQIGHVRAVLSEKNLAPPSRGGIALVQQSVDLTKAFQSTDKAVEVIKALLDIKGINKADKKDILYSVSACIQRTAQSPSPAILDLSREEEDEEARDDSGFSSQPSSRHEDESF